MTGTNALEQETHDLPDGYRMTELGPLPAEWRVVRLGEVAHVRYGKAKPNSSGAVPVVGSGGIYAWTSNPLIDFPTLVIGRKGTAGQVWLAEGPCWPSDTTFYLEWKQPIEVSLLYYYFLANPLSGEHAKTTLPSLQRPDLENCPIPLPLLSEQRAIAHVLRTVQKAKEATERVIAALRELKKSLMRYLFTYGPVPLDAADRVELKDTEIGPIPSHWRVVRLGEVVKYMKAGGTPKRTVQSYWDGGIPFVLIEDITRSGIFLKHTKETISETGLRNSSAWIVPEGSVLLTMYGTIGLTAINEIPVATNQAILAIVPGDNVDSLFLAYLLRYEAKRLESENVQSTQKNVSKQIVQRFPIPLPPRDEQHEIARILRTVDEKIQAEEKRKEVLEALFKALLHYLMTAKIRLPKEFVTQFEGVSSSG